MKLEIITRTINETLAALEKTNDCCCDEQPCLIKDEDRDMFRSVYTTSILDTSSIESVFRAQAEELRTAYNLECISLDKIVEAIRNNSGDLDLTLAALFN